MLNNGQRLPLQGAFKLLSAGISRKLSCLTSLARSDPMLEDEYRSLESSLGAPSSGQSMAGLCIANDALLLRLLAHALHSGVRREALALRAANGHAMKFSTVVKGYLARSWSRHMHW